MFYRSEQGIGRAEVAEGEVDAPLFILFALFGALLVLVVHFKFHSIPYTIAASGSLLIFCVTLLRVEWGIYALVISMLLSPEISAGSVGVAAQRTMSIRYGDFLIIVIFLGVLLKMAFQGRRMFWLPNPVNSGIILYYGVCIISTLLALRANVPAWDMRTAALVMVKMLQFYIIFWTVTNAIDSIASIRRQLTLFFAVSIIVAVYCITTIGGGPYNRISAPFELGGSEPNTLGGYLTIVILAAAALFLRAPNVRARFALAAVAALAFIPFLYTLSRASYLALIFGFLTLGLIGRRFWMIAAVACVLLFSNQLMPNDVRERVNYTFQETYGVPVQIFGLETGLKVDKSTYERIYVWSKVQFNLKVWPWFGGGVEWDRVLDSQYARVLIETGIFGFVAFLFLQWRIYRTSREAYLWSRNWIVQGTALGCTAILIALIVHSMGTISFLIVRIMEPFWFLVALVVVGRAIAIESHRQQLLEARRQEAEEESNQGEFTEQSPQPVS
jgi:hypothetical protein